MVSISHDWKEKTEERDQIHINEEYEKHNEKCSVKMARASELASELSGKRLFPGYFEVSSSYLNPLESIEPRKVSAIPMKGLSASYKIRNSMLVKNLLNDRPLNVLNGNQCRFNSNAYMNSSKKRPMPPKALNQSNFNPQADSNTSASLTFNISVSSFNKAMPYRRSSVDFQLEHNP